MGRLERPAILNRPFLVLVLSAPPAFEALPVIVYFHGGGLIFGSGEAISLWLATGSSSDCYGRAIGVTVNYRLNVFGWLATSDLSAEQNGTSGNYGLLDQQMALRWVKQNIASFGGDPARVTVMGQSSGGTSVMALMSSPGSRGLFTRAIALSGSPNMTMDLTTAQAQNDAIVSQLPCTGSTSAARLACLRGLDQGTIAAVMPNSWGCSGIFGMPPGVSGQLYPGLAVVDGKVIKSSFLQSLHDDVVPGVTLLMGNMGTCVMM